MGRRVAFQVAVREDLWNDLVEGRLKPSSSPSPLKSNRKIPVWIVFGAQSFPFLCLNDLIFS